LQTGNAFPPINKLKWDICTKFTVLLLLLIFSLVSLLAYFLQYKKLLYVLKVMWYTMQKENKGLRGRAEGGSRSLGPCAQTHICSTYVCRLFAQFASLQGEPDCDVVRRCSSVSRAVQFTLKQRNRYKQSASFWSAVLKGDTCSFAGKTSAISHTLRKTKSSGFKQRLDNFLLHNFSIVATVERTFF